MGCASGAVGRARVAEQQQDYDRAVVEYTQALKERPEDKDARLALDRARIRASQDHFQRGRRLEAVGQYEEALLELQLAAELNPSNGDVEELLRSTRLALRNKIAVSREGKTKLENADGARARVGTDRARAAEGRQAARHRSCSATPAAVTS